MEFNFARNLRNLRLKNNLSQQQLAEKLYVNRSTIALWENERRFPDIMLLFRIADFFNVNVSSLMKSDNTEDSTSNVIILDDEEILLAGAIPVLSEAIPNVDITGFLRPSEAIEFAENNKVSIAFLDIEIGNISGFNVYQKLHAINPHTNIIFLTAYSDYALKAWETSASGFLVKPLILNDVLMQLEKLRYPL